jgi:hypothetical protein
MIIGLDIGTSEYGLSIASDCLRQSILYRPKSSNVKDLNDTLEDLRE